jgi:hypothetical protein
MCLSSKCGGEKEGLKRVVVLILVNALALYLSNPSGKYSPHFKDEGQALS